MSWGGAKSSSKCHFGYGWLNPYYTRCPDGDTELEQMTILSKTTIRELLKDVKADFGVDETSQG